MRKRVVFAVSFALLFSTVALTTAWGQPGTPSGSPPVTEKDKTWTVDDVIMIERADQFRISPDSKWAVWVKFTPDADKDGMVSNLFLSSLTEKKEVQLTRGTDRNFGPKWSPDGQLIAFISNRPLPKTKEGQPAPTPSGQAGEPSPMQLWLINPFGGEPWPLTRSERSVKDFDWLDAGIILIAAEEDPSLYERTVKEKKDASRVVEDAAHTPPVRLFKINAKTQAISRVTDNNDWIESLALSPDGKKVVTVHARSLSYQFDQKVKPVTFLYDVATGKGKQLFTDGKILPFGVRWTFDSSGFYAISPYSTHPIYRQATVNQLYYYDVAAEKAVKVDLGWENELGFDYEITNDGFIALLAAGSRFKPARYTRAEETWRRGWIEGEHANNLFSIVLGKDSQMLLYNTSTASRPEQWYRATLEGATVLKPVPLTDLNPNLQKKTVARTEVTRWIGALGEEVEGILYYPHHHEAGKKYPLVLMIHGGPTGFDMDSWDENWGSPTNLFNQRGAFVLKPNYHGSGNYGLKWAESIGEGKYYDLEVPDIEMGVDALIARGLVDPDRLGTMGWSNGAILTIALTVNSTRYKAASAGAGDVEWISDWGNVDFGAAFDNYYLGKPPIDDPELYIRKSPIFKMKNMRTPTIIFFGTEDRNVPTSQGWTHYRTLQQLGQTDVRFILFPGEAHGPRKLTHQRRKVEEELAWFDKYLFKADKPKNEAFKDDSPLGAKLKRQKIKKVGLRYGILEKKTLAPEVVRYQGLELGRFEVTRAQYAAFDKTYKFDPATEDFPASGISFENAKAYCAGLSQLTGQTYRLGEEEEMKALYRPASGARPGENTLDYWAGYAPNPDDSARLQEKVKELPGPTPLLKEVGSFKGVGEDDLVFDLGGNAAEWVITKEGTGKAVGGSADQPADAKAASRVPDPAYIGFRVVRGESKPAKH